MKMYLKQLVYTEGSGFVVLFSFSFNCELVR